MHRTRAGSGGNGHRKHREGYRQAGKVGRWLNGNRCVRDKAGKGKKAGRQSSTGTSHPWKARQHRQMRGRGMWGSGSRNNKREGQKKKHVGWAGKAMGMLWNLHAKLKGRWARNQQRNTW